MPFPCPSLPTACPNHKESTARLLGTCSDDLLLHAECSEGHPWEMKLVRNKVTLTF